MAGTEFDAKLVRYKGEKLEKLSLGEEGVAMEAKAAVEGGPLSLLRRLRRNL